MAGMGEEERIALFIAEMNGEVDIEITVDEALVEVESPADDQRPVLIAEETGEGDDTKPDITRVTPTDLMEALTSAARTPTPDLLAVRTRAAATCRETIARSAARAASAASEETPLPLIGETRDYADRVRHVLMTECSWPKEMADQLLAKACALMPEVRR